MKRPGLWAIFDATAVFALLALETTQTLQTRKYMGQVKDPRYYCAAQTPW